MAATPNIGFGFAPFGFTPFGFGVPATANQNTGQPLTKADGTPGEARYIDPLTRDYVYDANGRAIGVDAVQNQVYLALLTVKSSSTVQELGSLFQNIKLITANLQAKVENEVRQALSSLIQAQRVELVSVTVDLTPSNQALIHISWRDLTKDILNQISI